MKEHNLKEKGFTKPEHFELLRFIDFMAVTIRDDILFDKTYSEDEKKGMLYFYDQLSFALSGGLHKEEKEK